MRLMKGDLRMFGKTLSEKSERICLTYFTARADWLQIPLPNRVTGSLAAAPLWMELARFEPPSEGDTLAQEERGCTELAKQAMVAAKPSAGHRSAQQRQARPVPR